MIIGDRVQIVENYQGIYEGETGTIVAKPSPTRATILLDIGVTVEYDQECMFQWMLLASLPEGLC